MRVLYHNRKRSPHEAAVGAVAVTFERLVAESDILAITAPLSAETHHVIDEAALGAMKPGSILVNTSRGPLVDEGALVRALRNGPLRAAGLDVYEHEPALEPGLTELENVVLLPHLGSGTEEARAAMVHLACDNIVAVMGGRPPLTPVA
jgi:glyoxylate reductase